MLSGYRKQSLPLFVDAKLARMANIETNIQQRIRLALGTRDDVRLFRNQVGQLPDPRTGRPVQFGLAKGSADIVGWTTKTITEDDVGKSYAKRNLHAALRSKLQLAV